MKVFVIGLVLDFVVELVVVWVCVDDDCIVGYVWCDVVWCWVVVVVVVVVVEYYVDVDVVVYVGLGWCG